ncbi:MAG: hypothetical protein CR986_02390 [Ignavibacteriae bacterium]|nr:MAG: hypothetical protein CR986_02390 [Ignavibacteriota bacterium]
MIDFENIDGVLVSREIFRTKFTCDLNACKGACCTMKSEYGAPLNTEEIQIINELLPIIKNYLPKKSIIEIEKNGFWEEKENELMTRSHGDTDCVFVFYENDIAKCAIEKAYKEEKINFIKPISCHLFPIRITNFGGDVIRYEEYHDCKPALKKGQKTGITIADFCKSSLERIYEDSFLKKLNKINGK